MFGPLIFRVAVAVGFGLGAGGYLGVRNVLFWIFVGFQFILSLVEGWFARRGVTPPIERGRVAPEQMPFVMAGKWYLLAQTTYQIVVIVVFARLARATAPMVDPLVITGGVLMVIGIALRTWSMAVLEERFRGWDVRREARGLERRGPYGLVRHPGYLALAMVDTAIPLLLGVEWLLPLVIVPLLVMVRRINLEEKLLQTAYPEEYAAYAAATSRLIPGVY